MTTTPQYDYIVASMPLDLGEKIMKVLEYAYAVSPGKNVTKQDLIWNVFGRWIDKRDLINSTEDRQLRDAIAELQLDGYPIIASSGLPGYRLEPDREKREEYCAEIEARIRQLEEKVRALRHPRVKYIYTPPQQATQHALF